MIKLFKGFIVVLFAPVLCVIAFIIIILGALIEFIGGMIRHDTRY